MRRQVREFLSTRRDRLTPEQAGLPAVSGHRRVKGLRREEVAALAGISVEYYIRLERGDATHVSQSVLEGISRALRLSGAEYAHLLDLLRAGTIACAPVTVPLRLRPPVQRILDSMTTTAALVHNGYLDVIGTNALGRALLQPPAPGGDRLNLARSVFLDPAARTFWPDWDAVADDVTGRLLAGSGQQPCDRVLTGLVDEISAGSQEFRTRWARHDVSFRTSGRQRLHHPVVGELDLPFESTALTADPGLTLLMYTAEPGTPSEDALRLLSSWTAVLR
ncbi:helix-turn-helix transcriptional regulator [Kineosporia mesophila]|uniref:Helix-turn-helix transcriptional regulator n=2 Tax=Kineosporia mesophila TaxID=566012 RepID=A0ABP7AMM1_9ACTN